MNFIALDFETANSSRSSVCSIGLVEYAAGKVVREYYRLVKPKKNYFSSMNTRIHGITRADVEDAKEFNELWEEEICSLVEGKLLIAHNAQFDMGVLRAVLDEYNLPYPMLAYNCTVNISKKTWSLPKYNLKAVTDFLHIPLNHHHALDDAKACGEIFIRAADRLQASTAKEVIDRTRTINGMMYEKGYEPARLNKRKKALLPGSYDYIAAVESREKNHRFTGVTVAFTGELSLIELTSAHQSIARKGGRISHAIEADTGYLIVGSQAYKEYKDGKKTVEIERAEILMSHGYPIELLSEETFMQWINE